MALDPRIRNAAGQFSGQTTVKPSALRKAWLLGTLTRRSRNVGTNLLDGPPKTFQNMTPKIIQLDAIPSTFTADKVDEVNAIIRGVSVITSGLIARGHDLTVDETTLKQMQACAEAKGQVPVKVDHKSGAAAVCGFLTNFRQESGKLKADWHLLESHPQKAQILEVARRMPRGVGLSAAFVAPEKPETTKDGKKAARCVDLISVDYVTLPAANPDGMFAAKVDSLQNAMNDELKAAIQEAVNAAIAPMQEQLAATKRQLELAQNPPSLEEIANMDEAQLAELGLTPEDVQEALDALAAEQQGEEGDDTEATNEVGDGTEGDGAEGDGAAATATAGAGAGTGFNAKVSRQLVELSTRLKTLAENQEKERVDVLLSSINAKIATLVQENDHLRQALASGSQPASPGVDRNGVRFFSAQKNEGEFENLVQLHIEEKKATRAQAFSAVIRDNPEAYQNYLVRLGVAKGE